MSDEARDADGEQPEAPPPEPVVQGITAIDFALWRQQPITRMFLQYLRDRRTDFVTAVSEQWLGGEIELSTAHEARGFAKCLGEVTDTKLATIAIFYEQLKLIEAGEPQNDDAEEDGGQGTPAA